MEWNEIKWRKEHKVKCGNEINPVLNLFRNLKKISMWRIEEMENKIFKLQCKRLKKNWIMWKK